MSLETRNEAEQRSSGPDAAKRQNWDTRKSLDDDMADEDKDVFTSSGIKMRDLGDVEVHQFPGLKREHWW